MCYPDGQPLASNLDQSPEAVKPLFLLEGDQGSNPLIKREIMSLHMLLHIVANQVRDSEMSQLNQ